MSVSELYSFYEFFAGGGMARAGLGPGWTCEFANDFSPAKAAAYAQNWGHELFCADVASLRPEGLPGHANMVWASFPCQDLSLAGKTAGLGGRSALRQTRSGSFWPFWNLVEALAADDRRPDIVVLENVVGLLHANYGADFAALGSALAAAGYNFGAVIIDACKFVPQSRPRVFVVAVAAELPIPLELIQRPGQRPSSTILEGAVERLSRDVQAHWLPWHLPEPPVRSLQLRDLIDADQVDVPWDSEVETAALIAAMSPVNFEKVKVAQRALDPQVGAVFKRTRPLSGGGRRVFAEVRFDGVAGCIRPPGGGSSRQRVLIIDRAQLRSRLLSPRELARLMGLPDTYVLPVRRNEAYQLLGDGVAVPAVRHLAANIIEPVLHAKELARLHDVWTRGLTNRA